jgi:hypothetical protein
MREITTDDERSPLLIRGVVNERSFCERMSRWETWWIILVTFFVVTYMVISGFIFLPPSSKSILPLSGSMVPCIYDIRMKGKMAVNNRFDYELWFSEMTDEIYSRLGYDIDYYHQCDKLLSPRPERPPTAANMKKKTNRMASDMATESRFFSSIFEDTPLQPSHKDFLGLDGETRF